jgi:hypothetical protein
VVGRAVAPETFARGPGGPARDAVLGTGRVELAGVEVGGLDIGRIGRSLTTTISVRRQLELAGAGTYIGEVLAQRDSALTRWPDRPADRPLAVYVRGAGRACRSSSASSTTRRAPTSASRGSTASRSPSRVARCGRATTAGG